MNEFKQKLELTLNRLYKENKLSIDTYAELMEFAEEKHTEQLLQADVVGQSEHLKCQCKKAKFTRTVDSDFNPLCGRCGKAL